MRVWDPSVQFGLCCTKDVSKSAFNIWDRHFGCPQIIKTVSDVSLWVLVKDWLLCTLWFFLGGFFFASTVLQNCVFPHANMGCYIIFWVLETDAWVIQTVPVPVWHLCSSVTAICMLSLKPHSLIFFRGLSERRKNSNSSWQTRSPDRLAAYKAVTANKRSPALTFSSLMTPFEACLWPPDERWLNIPSRHSCWTCKGNVLLFGCQIFHFLRFLSAIWS